MNSDQSSELDPEVLQDPLGTPEPAATRALTPLSGRELAPSDPFRRYLAEVRRYPPLTREEEQELARQYRDTGDREALFRLITANLMLVVRVAQSFRRAARNILDLIQEGNIGLMQAVQKFDPEMGNRLTTYASWWIRAYMVKFLLDHARLVRVGTTNARRKLLHNLEKEKRKLEELGYEVGPKLLAEHFGVSERDVTDIQMALGSHDLMLDAPVGEGDGPSHGDLMEGEAANVEEEVARKELQQRVEAALDKFRAGMSERDRMILDLRILSEDPVTLQEIGKRFGTSREAARQAEVRIKDRLKAFLLEEMGDAGKIRFEK